MPQFLATHYEGLQVTRLEIIAAPHIAKARAHVLEASYPAAQARLIGSANAQREEFSLRFCDEEKHFRHLAVTVSLHRADTFAFELGAARLQGRTL